MLYDRIVLDYSNHLRDHDGTLPPYGKFSGRLPVTQEDLTIELAPPEVHELPPYSAPFETPRAKYLARKYLHVRFPAEITDPHFAGIQRAIEEQRNLCEAGGFARLGGAALARLPHATSFSIGEGYKSALESMVQSIVEPWLFISSSRRWPPGPPDDLFVSPAWRLSVVFRMLTAPE